MTAYLRFSTDVNGAVRDHPQRNLKDLSRVISKARSRKREIIVGAKTDYMDHGFFSRTCQLLLEP